MKRERATLSSPIAAVLARDLSALSRRPPSAFAAAAPERTSVRAVMCVCEPLSCAIETESCRCRLPFPLLDCTTSAAWVRSPTADPYLECPALRSVHRKVSIRPLPLALTVRGSKVIRSGPAWQGLVRVRLRLDLGARARVRARLSPLGARLAVVARRQIACTEDPRHVHLEPLPRELQTRGGVDRVSEERELRLDAPDHAREHMARVHAHAHADRLGLSLLGSGQGLSLLGSGLELSLLGPRLAIGARSEIAVTEDRRHVHLRVRVRVRVKG